MREEYCIMQRCRFPGYWEALHACWIQHGELHARLNHHHYYERARRIGVYPNEVFLYQYGDAMRIVDVLKVQHPFAEFYLLRYVS